LRSSDSSIFSVVLMHMNMHQRGIQVKRHFITDLGHDGRAHCPILWRQRGRLWSSAGKVRGYTVTPGRSPWGSARTGAAGP
jgi:hypothetical protein